MQPDERAKSVEGPIRVIDVDKVDKEPPRILDGFEWVTMDLEQEDGRGPISVADNAC